MTVIIDRFEDGFAVVETGDKQFINIPRGVLPANAKEGDVISIIVDSDETKRRQRASADQANQSFKD